MSRTTIRNVLRRRQLHPAPRRGHTSWRTFLNHYHHQLLACDFFAVETICLKTIYVLFFIEMGTRRVYIAGCTPSPNQAWVTQQARQHVWRMEDLGRSMRYLIHDRDRKFTKTFDQIFHSEGIEVVLTPFRAPTANAIAERWVRSVREECLDQLLIMNQRHLLHVLREYTDYYNTARPHQGLRQQIPIPIAQLDRGAIHRRAILGGILHDYYRSSA